MTRHTKSPPADSGKADAAGQRQAAVGKNWWLISIAAVILPWASQPPLAWWPVAFVSLVPLMFAATQPQMTRRRGWVLYLALVVYWALSLQGLRHANPLIYPCWIALSAYMAIYPIAFARLMRRLVSRSTTLLIVSPLVWVGLECIRNYFLTGLSALMLGHTMADVPVMIQIADLGGTYAVSFVVATVNLCLFQWVVYAINRQTKRRDESKRTFPLYETIAAILLVAATLGYGRYRINQPTRESDATIALIGGNEDVEYEQSASRSLELFDAYVRESVRAVESTDETIDAVVWPESMFTGSLPWAIGNGSASLVEETGLPIDQLRSMLEEQRSRFQFRAARVQSKLRNNSDGQSSPSNWTPPQIIGGCGVIDYGEATRGFSGLVQIGSDGNVIEWYGKMHLVMFGEYVPLVKHLPIVNRFVPPGMGLTVGDGPRSFQVGPITLCPNICIETAVERVAINHFRRLQRETGTIPDAIVTVTNDGWFDDSSIVQHHKRCAQLVAVACRRPILSAANNGPTAWIDSCGRVVQEVPQGAAGSVIAKPRLDDRVSWVLSLGDWPARLCAVFCVAAIFVRRPS